MTPIRALVAITEIGGLNNPSPLPELIFVTNITNQISGEKICHMEKFQLSMHDDCGEIRNISMCGVISDFSTQQMWQNMKFLHIWHVFDVKMSTRMQNLCYFVIKSVFFAIYTICREICLVVIYALLRGEKIVRKLH